VVAKGEVEELTESEEVVEGAAEEITLEVVEVMHDIS
jgi:hypothetical protein